VPATSSELRRDPITGQWVILAAERARRPGAFVRDEITVQPAATCPFCPGNERETPPEVLSYRNAGAANQPGWWMRVVPNKFPALRVEGEVDAAAVGLFDRMNGLGAHEVIIETPDHQQSLSEVAEERLAHVFFAYRDRFNDLKRDVRLKYIQVFKNHGSSAGATISHAHSQLLAFPSVPPAIREELEGASRHFAMRERCVFCDIVHQEMAAQERVILSTEHFVALAPYASRFPFEVMILPRRHGSHFEHTDDLRIRNLGWVMRSVLRRLDQALERPAYNFVLHTAPVQEGPMEHYHWHIEILPKLTRVAGFELGTGVFVNPTAPEEAAQFLREARL
jgi:UDPglucose--hexose-1-phosphate uridylyltransferase